MRIIKIPIPNTATAYRIDLDRPTHQDWLAWRYVTGETIDQLATALGIPCETVDEVIKTVSDRSRPGPRTGKPGDFTYHYLRKDVSEVASYVLDRFETLSIKKADDAGLDIKGLRNLWGCDFLLRDKELGERMKGGDKWSTVQAPRDEMAEAIWPIDHAFVVVFNSDIRMFRFVSVTPQQVRGRAKCVPPGKKMLQATYGIFANNGKWECNEFIIGLFGGQWRHIDSYADVKSATWLDWISDNLLPAVLTARYNWHVAFGTMGADGPRLLLPTNPTASLQLFRNRERVSGETRRQKLKHWVSEHWRDGETSLEYVCNHLRGNTRFQWYDLECELFVSEYDLHMAGFFKAQASEWRSRRVHNLAKLRKGNGHEIRVG